MYIFNTYFETRQQRERDSNNDKQTNKQKLHIEAFQK